ncbi:MAG: hypothetical protein JW918_20070 [Anaerolineae bacterium]|nr:hypothetical protein [Anaerolineae bacterium]
MALSGRGRNWHGEGWRNARETCGVRGNARSVLVWFVAGLSLLAALCLTLSPSVFPSRVVRAQVGGWSDPVNLSNTETKSWIPAIAADDFGNVHVLWGEWLDDDNDWGDAIYYTMWDGETWSVPNDVLISPAGAVSDLPAIAADSQGRLHVVWEAQPGIYYSQAWIQDSPWLATAWSPPKAISLVGRGRAYIAVDDEDNVHVVWIDPPPDTRILDGELCPDCWDVYYTRSSDGGQSWSAPINLSDSVYRPAYPFLAIDGQGVIHAAWDEHNAADQAITGGYSRSLDGGATWSQPWDVGRDVAPENLVSLHVGLGAEGQVYLTWRLWQAAGTFLRRSTNGGETWSPIVRLPQLDYGGYGYLETASDSAGRLYLAASAGPYENKEVYVGQWGANDWMWLLDVSDTPVHSSRPRLVVSEGNVVHLVWFEHTEGQATIHEEGNMEIWYSRLETDAPHLPARALPARPPVTATPAPDAYPTPTPVPTQASLAPPLRLDDSPALSPNPGTAIWTGMAAAAVVVGLVTAVRLWLGRRGDRR